MTDYVELGPTPAEEDCEPLGPNYDPARARAECRAFINQLRRQFGEPPAGAAFVIRSNPHDFGSYLEVAVRFSDRDEAAIGFAFLVEREALGRWDEEARRELASLVAG